MLEALFKKHRLLRTTALRIALLYALYFALLMGLGLGALYWANSRFIDAQIAANLEHQMEKLKSLDPGQRLKQLQEILAREALADNNNRLYLLLLSPTGKRLAGNLTAWPPGVVDNGTVRNAWIDSDYIQGRFPDHDGYWPVIAARLKDGSRLLVTQSIVQAEDLREFTLTAMITILFIAVGLTLLLGWRLGNRILERIDKINSVAGLIGRGNLEQRVPLSGNNDEFDELSSHLNDMLLRLQRLIRGMQDVTDNVAHDLRRPLSRLRNRIEVVLLKNRDAAAYRKTLEEVLTDTDELIETFNALLEIAQAESGSYRGDWETVALSELADNLGELFKDMAETHGQRFDMMIQQGVKVTGNPHLLAQAISNLLENAIKFTPEQGTIQLLIEQRNRHAIITVSDSGPGIPIEARQRVLQRFVRLDAARSTAGNGLGLSLVKAVALLHKAVLILDDNHPGLKVSLQFPREIISHVNES